MRNADKLRKISNYGTFVQLLDQLGIYVLESIFKGLLYQVRLCKARAAGTKTQFNATNVVGV